MTWLLPISLADGYQHIKAMVEGRSSKWPACRAAHLRREPRCIACGKDRDLDVHHEVPFHVDRLRELDPTNLATLCRRCHLLIGHLDDWQTWNPYVRQDAALLRERIETDRARRKAA